MKQTCSSERLVTTHKNTQCHNPEIRNTNLYGRENLKYKTADEWLSRTGVCEWIQVDEFPVCIRKRVSLIKNRQSKLQMNHMGLILNAQKSSDITNSNNFTDINSTLKKFESW
jgi:hypothetical protein